MDTIEAIQDLMKDYFSRENLEKILKNVELPEQNGATYRPAKLFICALSKSGLLFDHFEPPRTASYERNMKTINRIKKELTWT